MVQMQDMALLNGRLQRQSLRGQVRVSGLARAKEAADKAAAEEHRRLEQLQRQVYV